MVKIIQRLLIYNQYLISQINDLLIFISKTHSFRQWKHQDSHSPKYQKFKVDKLPTIILFEKQDYMFLLEYYLCKYNKPLKPVNKRSQNTIATDICCPKCSAPYDYIYLNNGEKDPANNQYKCKVCATTFLESNRVSKPIKLKCPHCQNALEHKKNRLHFRIHKCVNDNCSYYKSNLRKLPKNLPNNQKIKYKLRYIYRECTLNFNFKKYSIHIMALCFTYHVNLGLSTRKTAHALREIHGVNISHVIVANYAKSSTYKTFC
jgi:hypothetical protein